MSCALKIGTESFGDFKDILFEDCRVVGSNRGLGIFSRDGGAVNGVRFRRVSVDCRETPDGFWGSGEAVTINVVDRRRDLRPTPADLAPAPEAAGRANAWVMGADGRIVGLLPYPGGMPGIYAENVADLMMEGVEIRRPDPLPADWNAETFIPSRTHRE